MSLFRYYGCRDGTVLGGGAVYIWFVGLYVLLVLLWIIWVVVGLGRSEQNRGSVAGFSLDCYLAYKIVMRGVYLIAAQLLLVID